LTVRSDDDIDRHGPKPALFEDPLRDRHECGAVLIRIQRLADELYVADAAVA
jgi:hypothetical protein